MRQVLCAVTVLLLSACSTVPEGFTFQQEVPSAIMAACPAADDKQTYKTREELESLIAMERARYNTCRQVTIMTLEGQNTAPGFTGPLPMFR